MNEPPEELAQWLRAGFRRPDAVTWRRWGFTLAQARNWLKSGVSTSLAAAQWRTAGVSPATVRHWRDAGITATEAVHWHEMGFTLDQAKEHKAHGRGPEAAFGHSQNTMVTRAAVAGFATGSGIVSAPSDVRKFLEAGIHGELTRGYLRAQWFDAEAVAWAKAGVEAHNARLWQTLGLTAAEVAELAREDRDPVRTVREWWRAGVPFDEVGDWLGAGLTAEEAATQRANGITVEQAAALRALRRNESGR